MDRFTRALTEAEKDDLAHEFIQEIEKKRRTPRKRYKKTDLTFKGYMKTQNATLVMFRDGGRDRDILKVKGGVHDVNIIFDDGDPNKSKFALTVVKGLGYKVYKDRGGFIIRIPKHPPRR